MGSRREEERNEKIIRGLMKLPPNRRCINCNSLGPQYVCTNFWTFVCITCSGIHREFTHRVKSVSMAKFTSQEVDALQKGGNQRAREIFLRDWDPQRQRLPESSNVDKVRAFIKHVYVDRKYAAGKASDKPPRDMQNHRNHEDQTRRASSYHSYSQSPPYDYQYEDRRYGKHAAVLTRKPGSDRGHYEGKISSFIYSPGRLSDQMYEDRFENEGTASRVSDYSASSGGDPFRSGTQSPNFQKDSGFNSPPMYPSRDMLAEEVRCQTINAFSEATIKRDADGIPHRMRTASSGSIGSVDSNSVSLKSINSGSVVDIISEPEQFTGMNQDFKATFPSVSQSSVNENSAGLDLFKAPFAQDAAMPSSSIDLFQSPAISHISLDPPTHSCQPPQTVPPSSVDFFSEIAQKQSTVTLDKKLQEFSIPKNEGWATFDTPQPMASTPVNENPTPAKVSLNNAGSMGNFDPNLSLNMGMQWPPFPSSGVHGPPSLLSNPWHDGLHDVQNPTSTSMESWNAFEDSVGHLTMESILQNISPQLPASRPSLTDKQYLGKKVSEDSNKDGTWQTISDGGGPAPSAPTIVVSGPSYTPPVLPFMGGALSKTTDRKSTNPFDLPFDSEEPSNMFLDMSSLQSALPNAQLSSSFLGGVNQPWFPQNPSTTFMPAAAPGGLAYMAGQAPSSQLPTVPQQGPVASVGGNPFA